jgi:UDP-4-amino-4,6-dideoxy-N-acetyl-beta-L-altrosamine N-acetyltransferase
MTNNNLIYTFVNFNELNEDDVMLIHKWRNNDKIRKWMHNQNKITLENHLKFMLNLKNNKLKLFFLVKRNGISVGVFSLNKIINQSADWGYYLNPNLHKQNLGVEFYYYVLNHIFNNLKFLKIYGHVLKENHSSISLSKLFKFIFRTNYHKNINYFYVELTFKKWTEKVVFCNKIKRFLELT